jgi:hypothetical protein
MTKEQAGVQVVRDQGKPAGPEEGPSLPAPAGSPVFLHPGPAGTGMDQQVYIIKYLLYRITHAA